MSNGAIPVTQYGIGDTTQIGGGRFALSDPIGLNPPGYGPTIQNASYAVPSVPPNYGDPSLTGMPPEADISSAMSAASSPLSLQLSPLLWVLIALVGGLFAIHKVHWNGL